ncbi:hypothetical protein BDR07DRAFT_1409662 [Suillus spraguei]|nr:hypothetical protein BDR07DRAFT_1409662 [Suillus spraguei]
MTLPPTLMSHQIRLLTMPVRAPLCHLKFRREDCLLIWHSAFCSCPLSQYSLFPAHTTHLDTRVQTHVSGQNSPPSRLPVTQQASYNLPCQRLAYKHGLSFLSYPSSSCSHLIMRVHTRSSFGTHYPCSFEAPAAAELNSYD